jgi:hypothetical protein
VQLLAISERTIGVAPGDEDPGVEGVDVWCSFSLPWLLPPEQDVEVEKHFQKAFIDR